MSVIRKLTDKIQLYNPATGEPLFSYDETNDQLDAEGNDLVSVGTADVTALEAEKADTRGGYEDVSSSRAFDTVETNTTGSDLDVKVVIESSADGVEIDLFLRTERPDGTVGSIDEHKQTLDSGQKTTVGITVPAGADYELQSFGSNYTIKKWSEQS